VYILAPCDFRCCTACNIKRFPESRVQGAHEPSAAAACRACAASDHTSWVSGDRVKICLPVNIQSVISCELEQPSRWSAGKLCEVVKLRNKLARAGGFEDFYDYKASRGGANSISALSSAGRCVADQPRCMHRKPWWCFTRRCKARRAFQSGSCLRSWMGWRGSRARSWRCHRWPFALPLVCQPAALLTSLRRMPHLAEAGDTCRL
jgi:hypothetical protein